MQSNPLRSRGIAHEEAYFRQMEAERFRRSRAEGSRQALRAELGAELGIEQATVLLDDLIELGITPELAPAFEALPLVEVAWADGGIDEEERWRVLGIATAFGLELGSPAHARLELWLEQRPHAELLDAWYRFAERALTLQPESPRALRLLEGTHEVAMAAGGLLGLGAVSAPERAAIERIRRVLGRCAA